VTTSTKNQSGKLPETLSTIVLIIVVLLVLAGFIRLVFVHWAYTFLILVAVVAAFYIYSQTKKSANPGR